MICFEEVSFAYEKGKEILKGLSFTIRDGEAVGLIGANGAGKSTLMKLLLGLLPAEGRITVDDLPVDKAHLSEVRRKLGFVLQNSDNQMFMPTVYEDMLFGLLNGGMRRDEAEAKVDAALAALGMTELKHRHNHKLSGGEKRMAAIATVLAMEPEALLMDEPTAALDPYNRRMVMNIIASLPQTRLITSHDLDMIYELCPRVLLLSGGTLVADGPAEEILRDEALLKRHRMELPLRFAG